MQWTGIWHAKTWSRRPFATLRGTYASCIGVSPVLGTATLKEFLDQELNENKDDEKLNYCQWETTNREILPTFTITNKEYKEALIDVTDDLTRYSDITKLKINSSWYRMKSKATTGLKNTGSYIHLHTLGCILIGIRC